MYSGRQGLYQTGRRFSLAGWSAAEWATFFQGIEQPAAQFYGTVTRQPVAAVPAPTVSTPLGAVPQWLPVAVLVGLAGVALARSRGGR